MRIELGEEVFASLPASATPEPHYGARVEIPYTRAIATAWQPAELIDDGDALTWQVHLESPVDVGDYILCWRSGDPDPAPEVFVPLMVG